MVRPVVLPPAEVCWWGLRRRAKSVAVPRMMPVSIEAPHREVGLALHVFVLGEFREAGRKHRVGGR